VRRNTAARIRTLLVSAFDDLEAELGRFVARLRGNERWQRKRGSRSAAAFRDASDQLRDERALIDRALAGDRTAFEVLADNRLAGVRREIQNTLAAQGHQPTDDELDRTLATTLTRAFRDLKRKPERWSIHGWLSWVARRELKARYGHQV
ncbi:MAG TPA: hypothetical protein VK864_19260, partial [Longimicrobiales bacterium]|nr:hypothetical protein [Longimicrobiales bacterium]